MPSFSEPGLPLLSLLEAGAANSAFSVTSSKFVFVFPTWYCSFHKHFWIYVLRHTYSCRSTENLWLFISLQYYVKFKNLSLISTHMVVCLPLQVWEAHILFHLNQLHQERWPLRAKSRAGNSQMIRYWLCYQRIYMLARESVSWLTFYKPRVVGYLLSDGIHNVLEEHMGRAVLIILPDPDGQSRNIPNTQRSLLKTE